MFLLILDRDPVKSANLIPDGLKFKQLIELCQLVCSSGISNVYKPIKQGKKIQEWIKENPCYICDYFQTLYKWCSNNINLKITTIADLYIIREDLLKYAFKYKLEFGYKEIDTAILRYSKDYEPFIKYKTNIELNIYDCVKEYKKYIKWKKENNVKGYE